MKHLPARLLLAFASLVCALFAANWAVDRWFPAPTLIYRLDPTLLYTLVPGARKVMALGPAAGGGRVVTEIDRDGFRGPELREPKRDPRVVVYGDSLVMADGVPLESTFVERLGARLGQGGLAVEMVNAGVTGYGPDQECLKLEREAERLAPDLVVLVLCAHNDLGDLVRDKLFGLDAQDRLTPNSCTIAESLASDFAAMERASRRPALLRAIDGARERRRERARMAAAPAREKPFVEWYLAAGRDEHAELVLERDLRVRTLFEDYYDADVAIHPEWESSQYKLRLMEAVLARIRDDCSARKIPLVALVVPSAVDMVPGHAIHVDPARYPTWSPARLAESFSGILGRLDVPFLDLSGPFRAAGPERLFVPGEDFHWNAAGQDLAADLVARFLLEKGIPPAPRGSSEKKSEGR